MRELTINEMQHVSGGCWADSFVVAGGDAMAAGGAIALWGLFITPGIPDGEAVGAALFLAGAVEFGFGRIGQSFFC